MTIKNIKQVTRSNNEVVENYSDYLVGVSALASHNIKEESFNLDEAIIKSNDGIATIKTKEGLQNMLASQMIALHELQQTAMAMAQGINNIEHQKYYISSAVKLANAFTAQATLLAKLQGVTGQKLIVERVDIHDGGQAVVGNIDYSR